MRIRTERLRRKTRRQWRPSAAGALMCLVLLLVVDVLRAQQTLPPRLVETFTKGVQALKAERLDEAETAFLEVLGKGGKLAFVYNNLGVVYQRRGDHRRAVQQFRQAVRLRPGYAAPRILMGASLLALGEVPEAIRQLGRAVKLEPADPLARWELAKVYERGGDLPGALEQLEKARELDPQNPEYAYQLGRVYEKLAGWCYKQIVRLDPGSARVYQTLAEYYYTRGQVEAALRAYGLATQIDSGLPGVHLALAHIYLEQGKQAEAREEIEKELAIVPESLAALALKQKIDAAGGGPQ